MTAEELNRLLDLAREAAFEAEDDLTLVVERSMVKAATLAARRFRRETAVVAAWTPPLTDVLLGEMSEEDQAEADSIMRDVAEVLALALASIGVGAALEGFYQMLSERRAAVVRLTLEEQINKIVMSAFNEGLTAEQTAALLREKITSLAPNTARIIAQTELTAITNERSLAAALAVQAEREGPLYKSWQTMMDNRVRPAHAAAQGQTVPLTATFSIGGFQMMYPGDPSAPLSLTARCRCHLSYTDSLVASGKEGTMTDPMTAAVTISITEGEATEEEAVKPVAWRALLAIENQPTEDGRMIREGALTWRDLPLSLMALDSTGPGGHEGAKVAGRIDNIERDGLELWATGEFDTGEFGQEIARLVGERTLRGNSVDLAVISYEYWNRDTMEKIPDDELLDAMFDDTALLFVVTEGVILASTVVPTPAIDGAEIMVASAAPLLTLRWSQAVVQPVEEDGELTASAAGLAPLHPPRAWFDDPVLDGPTPLTVEDSGRVYGHLALFDTCHIGEPRGPGICTPPPRSELGYSIFHHGAVRTDEGIEVPVGQITLGTTHAGRGKSWSEAMQHYEHTGLCAADVRVGEDRHGIWVAGALRPDMPASKVREFKAGALSGDWRQVIGRGLELIAALVVNVPGFPIPRPEARIVASAVGEEEVLALVAAGIVAPDEETEETMTLRSYMRQRDALTEGVR